MEVTMHAVEINADIEKVYDVCANIRKWPEYFPPCKKVTMISEHNGRQVMEITAKSNEEEFTWQSERNLYPGSYRIDFHQSTPSPLVKYMEGIWRVIRLNRGVLLSLEHTFEIKDHVEGLVKGVHTKEEALQFMHRAIENNSRQELGAIKALLETKSATNATAVFKAEIAINAAAEQVFQLLYDVKNWPNLLPHCGEIVMLYEDGCNQEFEMTIVNTLGKTEIMRSIRHGYANKMIEYFQPSPPLALKQHSGQWIIHETESGVCLEAWHSVTLSEEGVRSLWGDIEPDKALKIIVQAIEKNSMTTMETIKAYLYKRAS